MTWLFSPQVALEKDRGRGFKVSVQDLKKIGVDRSLEFAAGGGY